MRAVRSPSILDRLRTAARQRATVDYEATRRARLSRESLAWASLSRLGLWTAPDFYGLGVVEPEAFRDRWGVVRIRGHVAHPAMTTQPIVLLPEDLRPDRTAEHPTILQAWTISHYSVQQAMLIADPAGLVSLKGPFATGSHIGFLSLDTVRSHAANRGQPR